MARLHPDGSGFRNFPVMCRSGSWPGRQRFAWKCCAGSMTGLCLPSVGRLVAVLLALAANDVIFARLRIKLDSG
jgi:hypothetical protein